MALSQKLELRQGQSLVMTPQLQQAIKLLQMSNLELQDFVEQELERNPLLERDDRGEEAAPSRATEEDAAASGTPEPAAIESLDRGRPDGDAASAYSEDADVATPGMSDSGWSSLRPAGAGPVGEDASGLEATLTRDVTLREHVEEQLSLATRDPATRMIGAHLAGLLDETGYLSADLEAVARQLGTSLESVEAALTLMQTFDPPGVFARDLKECLALQLKERDRYDPAMAALVSRLDLVARKDFAALKQICGVDQDDLRDMLGELRALNPKPGNAFGSVVVQPVIPDVHVKLAADGTWLVELNTETLPKVLLNNQYHATVSRSAKRDEDRLYLSQCQSSATWLIKSLDQRARTILKVAKEIVRQQDAFLVEGIQALKPLNLRTVAEAVSMHESTISRVTSNKYMATPRGIFELKYFFTTAIASAEGGEAHSAEAVRHRIKGLIESEEGDAVLSDDQIVAVLRGSGIDIARRTVAKYRESLGIASSVQRRRERRAYS
ncbi:MAG: RNA polymerase factor sigma-54 [Parvibaculaceae bacterium]